MKSALSTRLARLSVLAVIASLLSVVPVNASLSSAAAPGLVSSAFDPSAAESNKFFVRVNVADPSGVAWFPDGMITGYTTFIYCSSGYIYTVPLMLVHYGTDPVLVGSTSTAPRGAAWGTCYALLDNQKALGVTRGVVEYQGTRSQVADPRTWVIYFTR